MPLKDLSDFIDAQKNLLIALLMIFAGLWVTVHPNITPEYAGQWVGSAMTAAGVYIGHRIESGKSS